MHHRKFAFELIFELGLGAANPVSIPLETNTKLTTKEYDNYIVIYGNSKDKLLSNPSRY